MAPSNRTSSSCAKNGLKSDERISEVAAILAIGLTRLSARKSSEFSADCGEISLSLSPGQSGCPTIPEHGEIP
jgi:hypothetical protein